MHGSGWCVPHDDASAWAGTSLACAATWAPVRGSGGQAWRAGGAAEVDHTVCSRCALGAGGGSGLGPEGRHQKEGEAWSVPSGSSGMRGSVGSPSDGDNQMRRKSRDGRKQPSLPVSSPPAASLPAPRHGVQRAARYRVPPPGCHRPGLWNLFQDSSWLLPWGPSLLCPGLDLFPHHLLCLHFIQASALLWFPDHPVSNQDFLSAYALLLPSFPALLFFTALVYLLDHCVTACFPFWKVRSSRAGTMSYSSRNPVAKSIAWHM